MKDTIMLTALPNYFPTLPTTVALAVLLTVIEYGLGFPGPSYDIEAAVALTLAWFAAWNAITGYMPRHKARYLALIHSVGWTALIPAIAALWRSSNHDATSVAAVGLVAIGVVAVANGLKKPSTMARSLIQYAVLAAIVTFIVMNSHNRPGDLTAFLTYGVLALGMGFLRSLKLIRQLWRAPPLV